MLKLILFQDSRGEWRWRLLASNHRIIADSGEGYARRANARRAAERLNVLLRAPGAEVVG